jgi:hypothetical protein
MSFLTELYTIITPDTIDVNKVSFHYTTDGIFYKGTLIQAKLVSTETGQVLTFETPPLVSTIDYLRLDHLYHFEKIATIPHSRKKPAYYDLAMDIYFSELLYSELRDRFEDIFKQNNIDVITDGLGYNLIVDKYLQCRISIFLADDESGHIIEFSHVDREYELYRKFIKLIRNEMLEDMY